VSFTSSKGHSRAQSTRYRNTSTVHLAYAFNSTRVLLNLENLNFQISYKEPEVEVNKILNELVGKLDFHIYKLRMPKMNHFVYEVNFCKL
jgi:hypothetical protein